MPFLFLLVAITVLVLSSIEIESPPFDPVSANNTDTCRPLVDGYFKRFLLIDKFYVCRLVVGEEKSLRSLLVFFFLFFFFFFSFCFLFAFVVFIIIIDDDGVFRLLGFFLSHPSK